MAGVKEVFGHNGTHIFEWTLTTADPTGDPMAIAGFTDRAMQVKGNFGGATLTPQGTLDQSSPTYFTIRDAQGSALTFTTADGRQLLQNLFQFRPKLTSVGVGATVTVKLIVSGSRWG